MERVNKKVNYISYIFLLVVLIFLFLTHPFMKYPYDIYFHLYEIDSFYDNLSRIPSKGKEYWYLWWDYIFHFFNIDNSKIFLRAYIIHYTNILIDFYSVYFFNFTLYCYFLISSNKVTIRYLSIWATFIWFIIFATSSMGQHLVWIQWYSVNYQLTLPLTLLLTSLCLHLIFGGYRLVKKNLLILSTIFLSYIILKLHSMEFLYFLMYIFVFGIIYLDKIFLFLKRYKTFALSVLVLFTIIIFNLRDIIDAISYMEPAIIKYILNGEFEELWLRILRDGNLLINGLNRAWASMNELIYLSLFFIIVFLLFIVYQIKREKKIFDIRLMLFIITTSLFVLIPTFKVTAGFASLLTHIHVVNRFYFSSTIFLVIPLTVWLFVYISKFKYKIFTFNLAVSLILLATFYYSKFNIASNQNFYKNIKSIKNSFNERKVGFNLSKEQREEIQHLANSYKCKNGQEPFFYAREDIAFVLKVIYKKNVYLPHVWRGVRLKKDFYIKAFNKDSRHKNKVLITVPKGFPSYEPYR